MGVAEDNKALAQIDKAERMLECADEIADVITLRNMAAAVHVAAAAQGFKDAAQKAKVFQLKAERKAGAWLRENVAHQGGEHTHRQDGGVPIGALPEGVDEHESRRWQLEAAVPEEKFHEWLDDIQAKGWEITAGGLQSYAKNIIKQEEGGDEGTPVTEEQADTNLVLAMILNSLRERDARWFASRQCQTYHEILGIPPDPIAVKWVSSGFHYSIFELIEERYKEAVRRLQGGG
jgi:hypothetical protein